MRSKIRMKVSGKTADGWYPWFAWYPVRTYVPIIEPNDPTDKAWVTIWLEYVEWRRTTINEPGPFIYRLRQYPGDRR